MKYLAWEEEDDPGKDAPVDIAAAAASANICGGRGLVVVVLVL